MTITVKPSPASADEFTVRVATLEEHFALPPSELAAVAAGNADRILNL
ncbi:hypothetical protein [Mycobacterium aquaticum]|nr:hypothetical protein [Mycobacterium aquaticum]